MVGLPVLGLLGVLEAGRHIPAPLSIGGEWTLVADPAWQCGGPAGAPLRQLTFNVSQSGTEALITLSDGRATAIEAVVAGRTVTAGSFHATIGGGLGARTLQGEVQFGGCPPAAFRAFRQAARKGVE